MTDVLKLLQAFEWRGQRYPLLARSVSFSHDGARHKFQFQDDEFIEQLGAQSLTFGYTIPLREDIAKGGYTDLFLRGYPTLFRDMRNREPGFLVDPILGRFRCVPTSFSDEVDVNKRDGTDVRVEFIHSPDPAAAEQAQPPPTLGGISTDAGKLDAELELVNWEQEPSPEPTTDPLNLVAGIGGQIQANQGKVVAALNDFADRCEKADAALERVENPDYTPLQAALRRNRMNAIDAAKRAQDPTKTIVRIARNQSRGVSTVAAEFGMTVEDLIKLNPSLARSPFVPAGTVINVYKRK